MQIRMETGVKSLWEYLLVGHPDGDVAKSVIEVKQDFFDTYKQRAAIEAKPQIRIASFLATESMEETVIKWIHRICSQHKSFPVTLNNYSGFPQHTIYLRIQDPAPFKQLATQLQVIDQYVRSNGCPEVTLVDRPHLTIAGGLDNAIYDRAMLDYSQKTFHETFLMTELVLLKRNNQFATCKEVNVFRFYPPDTNTYGEVAQQLKQPV